METNKNCKAAGTVEQKKKATSLSKVLTEIYNEQYELNGLKEHEVEEKRFDHNNKYGNNSRNIIPELQNYIHERRIWFETIITALIDSDAYQILKKGKKEFSFSESDTIKNFLSSIFSNDAYFSMLRRNIMNREYFKVAEEDVEILRFWMQTLYQEADCSKEEIEDILKKFDAHFSLKFRQIQKELNILSYVLSENHIMLFSEEDYEYTLKKIEELIDDVMPRMKWDKDDIKILKKLREN